MTSGSVAGRQDAITSFAHKLRGVGPRRPRIPRLLVLVVGSGSISLGLFISLQPQRFARKLVIC